MGSSSSSDLSRITIVAPRVRVDLALPSDIPAAELMPRLFELTQLAADDGGALYGGWCLRRLGGPELDSARSLAELEVLDGELLLLRPRTDAVPTPTYDEIVDAIAAAAAESPSRWDRRLAHHFGLTVAAAALWLTAVSLFRLPVPGPAVQLALALVALLITAGAAVSRTGGDTPMAVVLASAALPSAAVAGLRAVPTAGLLNGFPAGGDVAAPCLMASTAVLTTAVVGLVTVGAGCAVFSAAATVSVLGTAAFAVAGFVAAPGAAFAAALVSAACILLLFVPRLAARLGALPMPMVPSSAAGLAAQPHPDFDEIRRRSHDCVSYLTGLYTGCGIIIGSSAVLLAIDGGIYAWILAFAAVAVLLLRSRSVIQTPHVMSLLLPGTTAGLGCLILLSRLLPAGQSLWTTIAATLVAAVSIGIGVIVPRRRFAPSTRRFIDLLEAMLISSLIPLALAVMGLYQVFRHL